MAVGGYDLGGRLARAARVLRETPEPGWDAMEDRVIAAVRETPRGGWPLTVVDPDPNPPPGTIVVTDLALRASIAHVLRDDPDYAVGAIEVTLDGMSVRAVLVELTGRYDADLNAAARRALLGCERVVDEVIGTVGTIPIEVVVTDVHR
jgi:hypothetical protein